MINMVNGGLNFSIWKIIYGSRTLYLLEKAKTWRYG